ncbi:MAG TPA: hypothetical protein VFE90_01390 [Myxococcales bacterium]|jgi:hypothetical protein|nr:hypothetical protein [Myxococcales bacterium]
MEPLIHSLTITVAQDMRELVHAPEAEPPVLLEKDPPNWRWRLPLGFVTMVTAGALLIAAGAVQQGVREQKHGARRHGRTKMHMKKVRPQPAPPRDQIVYPT